MAEIALTPPLCWAAGRDAGNRRFLQAHSTLKPWTAEDADRATETTLRLLVMGGFMSLEMARGCGLDITDDLVPFAVSTSEALANHAAEFCVAAEPK